MNEGSLPDLKQLTSLFRTGAIDRRALVVGAFLGHEPCATILGSEAPPPVDPSSVPLHDLGPFEDGWAVEEALYLGMFFAQRFRDVWEDAWDANSRVRRDIDLFSAPSRALRMVEEGNLEGYSELAPLFTRLSDIWPFDEAEILGQRYGGGVQGLAEAARDKQAPYLVPFWEIVEKKGIATLSPEIRSVMLHHAFSETLRR